MSNYFRFTLCTLVLLFTTTLAFAQSNAAYYWADDQKISISPDRSSLVLQFEDGYNVVDYLKADESLLKDLEIHRIQGRAVLTFNNTVQGTALEVASTFVSNAAALKSASFGFQLDDGFQVWPTHKVVLQLNDGVTMSDLTALMAESKASFAKEKYGRVLLAVDDINQVVPFANQLQESGLTKWAHPDFYAKINHYSTPTDPLYANQFQMNNSNDIDCDAPEAWAITRGSANIRVAVIDDGVETHPDLPNLNTTLGYSPANNADGTPNTGDAHGVACAGIINAAHNGVGVAGIAPDVEIFSVNIFEGGETGSDLANAITYAKNNGADVLSNSWGYGSCTYSLSVLNSALADAKANGRGGKGCVIVFASGNDFFSCVSYPGNNDNVIGVGAITNTGLRSSYSNQGPKLDISAPSNGGTLGVYTTDRVGSAGYDPSSYTSTFGGTSAACPLVAGVAALVLSVNDGLCSDDVQSIMENTATDMGSSGFDVEFGNGRVDADNAVNAALANAGAACGNGGGGTSDPGPVQIFGDFFENGFGNWNDGGADCARYRGNRSWEGSYSIRLRNGTSSSIMTSNAFDGSTYASVEVSFFFYASGMDNGDDFSLEVNTGAGWTTVATYANFNNSAFYTTSVPVTTLSSNMELRFRCNANNRNDQIYIDQVIVTGMPSAGTASPTLQRLSAPTTMNTTFTDVEAQELNNMNLYPNPANSTINIDLGEITTSYTGRMVDVTGRTVWVGELEAGANAIDIANLSTGVYYVAVVKADGEVITKKFIKQ